jgi:hypothetical protein
MLMINDNWRRPLCSAVNTYVDTRHAGVVFIPQCVNRNRGEARPDCFLCGCCGKPCTHFHSLRRMYIMLSIYNSIIHAIRTLLLIRAHILYIHTSRQVLYCFHLPVILVKLQGKQIHYN